MPRRVVNFVMASLIVLAGTLVLARQAPPSGWWSGSTAVQAPATIGVTIPGSLATGEPLSGRVTLVGGAGAAAVRMIRMDILPAGPNPRTPVATLFIEGGGLHLGPDQAHYSFKWNGRNAAGGLPAAGQYEVHVSVTLDRTTSDLLMPVVGRSVTLRIVERLE